MKNQKKKSSLPCLLAILALLTTFLLYLFISAFVLGSYDDNEESKTIEVSAVIPKSTKAEITTTTTEESKTETKTNPTTTKVTEEETTTETTTESTKTTKTITITTEPVTEETIEFEFTQLYSDFFEPYEKSFGKLTLDDFQQENSEKFADYEVEITEGNENDLWTFDISDGENKVYIAFYPSNDMYENPPEEWKWTLSTLSYDSNGNEISISDRFHLNSKPTYTIYDKDSETHSKEVSNADELKKFMFTADKKVITENTTETTPTVPVTEPPTEKPTETQPPVIETVPVQTTLHFVLNTDSNCIHINPDCNAAQQILPENYSEIDISEADLDSYINVYWACGKCTRAYQNILPKF